MWLEIAKQVTHASLTQAKENGSIFQIHANV